MSTSGAFASGFVAGAGAVLLLLVLLRVVAPWIRVVTSGGRASVWSILGMRLRGNPPSLLIDAYLAVLHAGEPITLREVESCYIANRARIFAPRDLVEALRRREQA